MTVLSTCQRRPHPFHPVVGPSNPTQSVMADSIPSMNVCRKCKQEKPADRFISKTKSSLACGRPTTDCLDCRNRRALVASKRTAEQAELSPIFREGLPLIDLQLGTPIQGSEPLHPLHFGTNSAARKSNAIKQIAKQINQISQNLISNKQIQNPGFEITFDIFDIGYDAGEHSWPGSWASFFTTYPVLRMCQGSGT
ncbi:hypothetical protein V3481_019307 [Fusarium oxysporum f. sp. vasinfectum]